MILSLFLLSFVSSVEASPPLPADKAFALSAYLDQNNQLILEWNIAPGYYLYRNQLKFTPAPFNHVEINKSPLPQGEPKHDMLHGNYQAYVGSLKIPVASIRSKKGVLNLNINYQGCSSAGFCYTPIKKTLKVDLAHITSVPQNLNQYVQNMGEAAKLPESEPQSERDFAKFFSGHHLPMIMLSFLGLGLLLAFTPCVLPMVPILSGIIIGQGKKKTKKKSFFLSLAYVSGMAITYALAGVVIALIGSSVQADLQQPWIIVLFSSLFVLLALSLFGFYELQLPARFQRQVTELSNKQSGGTYLGVFLMGCLSTLIVSPCVSAPLVGVLAYIGQTGDVMLGALALLALGIGMGIPLLLIGISADRILPKAGSWMTLIERLFGFVMLGIAIWMLSRMIPGPVTLILWAILLMVVAIYVGLYFPLPKRMQWLAQGLAAAILTYGIILMIGAVKGNSNFFDPWGEFNGTHSTLNAKAYFKIVRSMDELNQQLALAKNNNQPALLDFYADWCNSCVIMDRTVFSREDVQKILAHAVVLRADLTANNAFDQDLLKRFSVVGPPTIIFFNRQGQQLTSPRIIGEVSAEEFLAQLTKIIY